MRRRLLLIPTLLAGCATHVPRVAGPCPLAGQQPRVQIEMFFGRDIAGQGAVTDAQWQAFASTVLSKAFPEGSTTLEAQGQWLDPQTNQTIHEPSLVILVSVEPASDFEMKIERVVDAYKQEFHQQSVGVVTQDVCARF